MISLTVYGIDQPDTFLWSVTNLKNVLFFRTLSSMTLIHKTRRISHIHVKVALPIVQFFTLNQTLQNDFLIF